MKGHILESHHLSVAKNPEAEVAPLPLLAFVTLPSHLLVMLLKQKRNTHCLVFIKQALVNRNIMFFVGSP
jgi:hypothetical protein